MYLYRFLFEQRLPVPNVQSCLFCLSYRCPSEVAEAGCFTWFPNGVPCFTPWLRPARPLGMWGTQHGYQTPLSWDWLAPCEASQGLAKRRRCVCFLEINLVISGLMTTWFYCCIELPHFCCQMTSIFQPFSWFHVISLAAILAFQQPWSWLVLWPPISVWDALLNLFARAIILFLSLWRLPEQNLLRPSNDDFLTQLITAKPVVGSQDPKGVLFRLRSFCGVVDPVDPYPSILKKEIWSCCPPPVARVNIHWRKHASHCADCIWFYSGILSAEVVLANVAAEAGFCA